MRITVLPLLALLPLCGCLEIGDWGNSDRFHEDFHYSYPLTAGGTVSVESFNGSIEIESWEKNEVEINGTKHAAERTIVDHIKIDVDATHDAVRIRTLRPDAMHGGAGVNFTLRVPRNVRLDGIRSSNGSLRIDDTVGNANLRTSNAEIRVSRLKGDVTAESSNGHIEANVDGNARLQTSNGSITADLTNGWLDATTSNSSIQAELTNPASNSPVHLESSNGHIEVTLHSGRTPDIRAVTNNSSITLRLPESTNARLRASTSHSSISSELNVSGQVDWSKDYVEGNIGTGGPLLNLSTSNGSIRIIRM